ncbi:mitogen-activated protein kinase kinase kinase 3-like isoform X4 [Miscanthus floridulus]|uniref:mitogen-activated protein kinase kinase kinase 3-like isoform X4 n=1 Tax=Miscanthus floridulus TaxID=154761 RepID=UPI00345A95B6
MPFWWPRRRSRPSSKRKDGPVPASASASCSPRHSVDVVPPTAYASASASPSVQWERAWTRSLGSPAPAPAPRGADRAAAATLCGGGGGGSGPGGAAAGRGQGLPLPRPAVYKSARGGSPVSSGSSSESDEVVDNTNYSESGKFCAIKEVQVILDDSKSKERLRQLKQEVDMLRQLSHQNIVQYYGSELTDEALSIYLEYVSGGSIHKLLRDYGPLKEPVIRNYTRQILSGLAYLHGRKTVHRDIKGANVLVGPNGEVKLADFGMAKHITSLAEIHSLRGSPYWMAPEVIMNKNGYSFEVDIWSLGCTIIEMGTGRHPWHQYEDVPAMFKIVNTNDMPEIPERFSKEGKYFLSLCLKRDPAQRPSATQLLRHPFVQDNQSNKEPSLKRSIAPLRGIGGIRVRGFMGSSSACVSPHKTSSRHIDVRANMSLPVSPCSSPSRQLKQSNWSCLASPSHLAFSSGSAAHNPVSYMQNQMRGSDSVPDPWRDISQRPQSPYGSPKGF